MPRFTRSTAQALLCAFALLMQATVLPLAHARHAAAARGAHDVVRPAAAAAPGAAVLHDGHGQTAPAPHDAAACPLCATVAQGRLGVAPPAVAGAAGAGPLWVVHAASAAPAERFAHAAGGPRAPPLFSA